MSCSFLADIACHHVSLMKIDCLQESRRIWVSFSYQANRTFNKIPIQVLSGPGRDHLTYWTSLNLVILRICQWPDEIGGQHPFELRSPWIPTGAGRSIREGQHQPWERTEARMGVRLLGRAILCRLVVVDINCDFVRTVKSYDLDRYAK